MALHPELQALLTTIEAAEADARSLVSGLTDTQGHWQPGGGARWSVAQCLDHLATINTFYMDYFLPIAERAKAQGGGPFAGVRPTWFGRRFVRILEPPVTMKAKAPSNAQPQSQVPPATALQRYLTSHDAYRRLVEVANDVDVNTVVVPNPWIKTVRMRVATALLVVPAHDRRHLWQARQVLADPAFPR